MRTRKSTQTTLAMLAALSLSVAGAPALAADSYEVKKEQTTITETTTEQSTTQGEQRPDAWVTTKVKTLLLADHFLTGLDIKVTTHDGVVQLAGWVKQPEHVSQAEKIASGVVGVKRVQNDLHVKP